MTTLMQKIFADSDERRQKAIFYVAKEVSGRALARVHKEKGKKFNWEAFSKKFEQSYRKYSADEMLREILDCVYWLTSEAEVMDLYFRYLKDLEKASGKQKENQDNDLDFS